MNFAHTKPQIPLITVRRKNPRIKLAKARQVRGTCHHILFGNGKPSTINPTSYSLNTFQWEEKEKTPEGSVKMW